MQALALAWELTSVTGWGIYGLNLTLELLARGQPRPILLSRPARLDPDPVQARLLAPLIAQQARIHDQVMAHGGPREVQLDFPVLKTLGGDFKPMPSGRWFFGTRDIGVVFFEDTSLSDAVVERARAWPLLVTGSTWNTDLLRARGLQNVRCVLQGVDPSRFHPSPARRLMPDRFVVFSGGKLEHRKGQDIVLRAFQRFHARHPDSVLLTCWQNAWPDKARDIVHGGLVSTLPRLRPDGSINIEGWSRDAGLPADAVVDLGFVPNHRMPSVLRQCDAAVFASRYESGTNLPAMESMACGLPVVLSDNTGHRDILSDDRCWPLRHQARVSPTRAGIGNDGWGESDVEELDSALEEIYVDRDEARRRGDRAATFMRGLSWSAQTASLLGAIAPVAG